MKRGGVSKENIHTLLKKVIDFYKLSLAGITLIIYPSRECSVSEISSGDRKINNLFYSVKIRLDLSGSKAEEVRTMPNSWRHLPFVTLLNIIVSISLWNL